VKKEKRKKKEEEEGNCGQEKEIELTFICLNLTPSISNFSLNKKMTVNINFSYIIDKAKQIYFQIIFLNMSLKIFMYENQNYNISFSIHLPNQRNFHLTLGWHFHSCATAMF
jgi:hypothetical protein